MYLYAYEYEENRIRLAKGMAHPAVCRHCAYLHDAGLSKTVHRYTDCSVWRCPRCETLIDDRPYSWGGSLTGDDVREQYRR